MSTRAILFSVSAAVCLSMMAATLVLSETASANPPVLATGLDFSIVNGEAVITGCGDHNCRSGLNIPPTIMINAEAIPVRHIAANAFEYTAGRPATDRDDGEPEVVIVGTVIIPDSVISIGEEAFDRQKFITNVVIGEGVTTIGAEAFYRAEALSTLTIPDSVTTIGDEAFRSNAITALTLGSGVQTIGRYAFNSNTLGHLTLPDSLTTLGDYSFSNARLTSVDFGASISSIGSSAFSSNQLTSVTLPASVASVANGAFGYNSTLTAFLLEGPAPTATAGVFTSSPNLTEILYRPVHTYPATWAGLPTRGVARPPEPPIGVTATPGDTMATVTWSAPATTDATVTAYTITSTPHDQTCTWSTGPLTCEVTGLTNGTAYSFSVVATSAGGTSTSSSASAPVTPLEPVASPTSPLPPLLLPLITAPATPSPSTTATVGTAPATSEQTSSEPATPSPLQNPTPSIDTIRQLPLLVAGLPVRATPGQPIGLTASGFTPGETVHLVIASTPQVLASGTADDTGAVSLSGTVPTDLTPGDHTVALYAPESGHGWRQAAVVSTTLPRTGDALAMASWSLMLLAMGGVLWLVTPAGRRSRRGDCPPRSN